jgi:O-antigen/teichoic acid export membrane protein
LLLTLVTQSQMWIIARWGGVTDVGIYGAVFKLSLVLSMMNMVFGGFMPPLVSKLYFSGNAARAESVLRIYATFSSIAVLACCLVVAVFGEDIVALLLGPQYVSGTKLLLLLCLLHLANQLCGHRGVVFLMLGHERLLLKIASVASVLSIGGGAIVMSQFGIYWYVLYVVQIGTLHALAEAHYARKVIKLRPYFDLRLLNPSSWQFKDARA